MDDVTWPANGVSPTRDEELEALIAIADGHLAINPGLLKEPVGAMLRNAIDALSLLRTEKAPAPAESGAVAGPTTLDAWVLRTLKEAKYILANNAVEGDIWAGRIRDDINGILSSEPTHPSPSVPGAVPDRASIIEECAKVAESHSELSGAYGGEIWIANKIASAIRSLSSRPAS